MKQINLAVDLCCLAAFCSDPFRALFQDSIQRNTCHCDMVYVGLLFIV